MGEWILSIAGVICLGILLDIVLPEGKTAKYVKGAFSLLVVIAIVAPLPKLIKNDFDINVDADIPSWSQNDDYTTAFYSAFEEKAQNALLQEGCESRVKIELTSGVINRVEVTVYNLILDGKDIVRITAKTLGISEDKVDVAYELF